jgi:thioesterase domain-containing protein/NRPS condensation-like uncharacterized protein
LKVEIAIASLFASLTIESLARQIDTASTKNSVAPILPSPHQSKIPLSLTQQRLWFLYQLEGKSSAYNIPLALEMKGVLQVNALNKAIAEIVRRHQILRTNFQLIDDNPVQIINPTRDIPLEIVDLRSLSESERNTKLQRLMETEIHRPFDLTQESLLRATLFQQTPDSQILLVNMHHIISDGWSLEVFVSELSAIYTAIVNQQPSPLPKLSIQYTDFAHWQREYLQGEIFETQLDYWREQLAQLPPLLELPTDKPRPAIQTYHGGIERFELSLELTNQLKTIGKKSGSTLFMTLLAAFATLLSRYSNSQDIAIGSPIANRNRTELEPLIGFFVNTLVLRTNLEGKPSFEELLQRVRQTTLDAYAHQDIQFDKLVEILQPERSLSHNPLFQVMFVLQNGTVKTQETSALSITPLAVDQVTAQFDLTLSMEETEAGLTGFWQYNRDLFEGETIQRLAANFQILLEQMVTFPEKPVAALSLLAEEERDRLLVQFNPQEQEYFQDCCIHQLFEEQVKLDPDRVAVVFEDQQLTYLNQTPSAFLQLIQVEESANITPKLNLRYVIFGGEALELQSLRPWFERHSDHEPQLVNMYGITETTVHVTYRPITMSNLEKPSSVIGCPIPDLQLYLLNGLSIEMIDDSQHWFERIEELVALYIKEIKTVQPQGPYYFGGISFGGMVALEAAQQLQAQGEKVALLALLDTWGPNAYVPHPNYKRFFTHLRKFAHSKLKYTFSKLSDKPNKVKQSFADRDQFDLDFSHQHYQDKNNKKFNKVTQTYLKARQNYVPQRYSGEITLFKSTNNDEMSAFGDFDDKLGWGELAAGGLDIVNVPGDHLGILKEPHVAILASRLQKCLEEASN